jgi:hypothetical protein
MSSLLSITSITSVTLSFPLSLLCCRSDGEALTGLAGRTHGAESHALQVFRQAVLTRAGGIYFVACIRGVDLLHSSVVRQNAEGEYEKDIAKRHD